MKHHDVSMRTTLTLEPDVAKLLEQEAARTRKPFKHVVNEALRRGLTRGQRRTSKVEIIPHRARLLPGFDAGSLNALADELEDVEVLRKAAR
jgi:hypothetical protein